MYLILGLDCILAFFKEEVLNIPDKLIQLKNYNFTLIITRTELEEINKGKPVTVQKVNSCIRKNELTLQDCINGNILTHYKNRYPQLGLCDISLILKGIEFHQQGNNYLSVIDWNPSIMQANEIGLKHMTTFSLLLLMRDKKIITNEELKELSKRL